MTLPQSLIITTLFLPAVVVMAEDAGTHSGHQVRAMIYALPMDYDTEVTIDSGSVETEIDDEGDFDAAGRLAVGYWWSSNRSRGIGFNLGTGITATTWDAEEEGNEDAIIGEFGAFIEPGMVFNFSPRFALEAGVPIGFGGSAATIEQPGDDIESEAGSYVEIGFALRPVYTFNFGLQLVAEIGGLAHTTYLEYDEDDFGGDEVEQDLDITGAYFALGGGYRF